MKQTINSLFALGLVVSIASCDMGKDKTATVVSADTSATVNVTDNMTSTASDSTTMVVNPPDTTASTAATSTGTAKPNPAKKGKKGTVNMVLPANKANADMEETDKEGYYTNVRPAYPGGDRSLANFFQNNIEYPQDAVDNGVEGTVNISFLMDENGKIYSPMTNPPRLGYGLEEEAMRVFNKMPKWTPGSLKGKNVKTRMTLPVTFQLQ
ncbi:MAG: TonB family protein [Chitinophagaceae bacterium]|nr:MAG: TonB family protein [Chitinophagaceae bacterium]